MRLGKKMFWVAFLLLANCGSNPSRTEFGDRLGKVESDYSQKTNKPISSVQATQLAVFSMTEGLRRDDAISLLISDGASCLEKTCSWVFTTRLSFYEKMFAILPPELLKGWKDIYSVSFTADPITTIDDILPIVDLMEEIE